MVQEGRSWVISLLPGQLSVNNTAAVKAVNTSFPWGQAFDKWMDNEDVEHTGNGIPLSHRRQWIWVSWSEVDETTFCYAVWIKSTTEILYINAHIWDLETWYWWAYLHGRNRDTDIKKRRVGTAGEGEVGVDWESSTGVYTLPCVKQTASGKLLCNTGNTTWHSETAQRVG